MNTTDLRISASAAAILAAFPRGPRIAFAPETGAGAVMSGGVKPPAVKKPIIRTDAVEAAPEGDKLDRILSALQALSETQTSTAARLDALEAKGKAGNTIDPEDLTEAEREELAKADGIEGEMSAIRDRMPLSTRQAADKAREDAIVRAQVRADAAFNLHGKRAPMPLAGETPMAYRVRLLRDHKQFSEAFKGVDLGAIAAAGEASFAPIEDRIYLDSAEASKRPVGPEDGGFVKRVKTDQAGRPVTEYFGRSTYVKALSPDAQRFVGFRIQPQAA